MSAGALPLSAQGERPTFRAEVELFLLTVQVRADRGAHLPDLGTTDFLIRVGSRKPPVLHAERLDWSTIDLASLPFSRWRWPKDEAAALYQLSVNADGADCRQTPKVAVAEARKGVNVRGWMWHPKTGCAPPELRTRGLIGR
jgi:hypothetical protein